MYNHWMKLYRTPDGILLADTAGFYFRVAEQDWDELFNREDLGSFLSSRVSRESSLAGFQLRDATLLAPLSRQEVWAAGVTYYRSRDARMEESRETGGGGESHYDRVYAAQRPELFFKASAHRVAGHLQGVKVRQDSQWTVPEPELALAVNSAGRIFGYTIGNDLSARDIEGENPLYLPQAKVWDGCCSLGPGILVRETALPGTTSIEMEISRAGKQVFRGSTRLNLMKRTPSELVEFLYRDNLFPHGCLLLTGTGIVPPHDFSLRRGDCITITIEEIGTLTNVVS
jgi:2-dehydro-3-deoxy-D-arabinonate dehydratase